MAAIDNINENGTANGVHGASPPFPDDVPTHPLLIVDYDLIVKGDEAETEKLWNAATKLGFWYLKNHGAGAEVEGMFQMGEETMKLPLGEKMQYEQGDGGMSFGYKASGANAVDATGRLDTVEFINVSKDDALAYPHVVHRSYPSTVNARMEKTIKPFVRKSVEVNETLLKVFERKLGLDKTGALVERHAVEEISGSEARVIRKEPQRGSGGTKEDGKNPTAAIGAHTDFGSLSFLHNRLGGLQVLVPGTETWQYIKPIPGHAVCNIGDALAIFSGGILRSNLHRVVAPPGAQAAHERWSLVFFTRPANTVLLNALVAESDEIFVTIAKAGLENRHRYMTGSTAAEWFARRIRNQRIKNRTGPETWQASRGTEHKPTAV